MKEGSQPVNTLSSNGFVFASGVMPTVPETGDCIEGGVSAQLEQAFENLKNLLASSESDLNHLVSIQVVVPSREASVIVDEACLRLLTGSKPAHSIIVGGSSHPSVLVEINAIAVLSPDRVEKILSEELAQALAGDEEYSEEPIVFKFAA
jgi:2-iminobutanoate/2-iminopropanoate deaminase